MGIIGDARPSSFEILPEGQHMVDLIFVTFIFVERLRIQRKKAGWFLLLLPSMLKFSSQIGDDLNFENCVSIHEYFLPLANSSDILHSSLVFLLISYHIRVIFFIFFPFFLFYSSSSLKIWLLGRRVWRRNRNKKEKKKREKEKKGKEIFFFLSLVFFSFFRFLLHTLRPSSHVFGMFSIAVVLCHTIKNLWGKLWLGLTREV